MRYWLIGGGRYTRTVIVNLRRFETWYCKYEIASGSPKCLEIQASGEMTAECTLSYLLKNLLGNKDKIEITERMAKLFEVAFQNTRRWKIYAKAWDIYNEKGLDATLDFLEEKLSLLLLKEKLEGEKYGRI